MVRIRFNVPRVKVRCQCQVPGYHIGAVPNTIYTILLLHKSAACLDREKINEEIRCGYCILHY